MSTTDRVLRKKVHSYYLDLGLELYSVTHFKWLIKMAKVFFSLTSELINHSFLSNSKMLWHPMCITHMFLLEYASSLSTATVPWGWF